MKRKSILALTLAMSMIMGSAMTVLATEYTADDESTGSTVTGEGDIGYVNTKVISVTLPTSETLKLIIDPQGLSALENGSTASKEDLEDAAGLITCANKAVVTNCSSVPVKVSVKLTGTGAATFVTDADSVEKAPTTGNKEENVLLYALPSAVDVEDSADNYVASTTGVTITTTAATVNFVLDPAEYNYSKDGTGKASYTIKEGETGHGTAIAFEGLVNSQADWSEYVKETSPSTIGMTAVFTYTSTLEDSDVADTTEGAPYGMVKMTSGTITVEAKNVGPSAPKTVNFTTESGATFNVNFGAGDSAATTITNIQYSTDGTTYKSFGTPANIYTISGNTVTIKTAFAAFDASGKGYLKVIFDKGDAAIVTIQKQ